MTGTELRNKICQHLRENDEHYKDYLTASQSVNSSGENFSKALERMSRNGIWNEEIADIVPLAVANFLQTQITIYSSRLRRPIEIIKSDMQKGRSEITAPNNGIIVAYLAFPGHEHYNACAKTKLLTNSTGNSNVTRIETTLKKSKNATSESIATPRKSANYISPEKKTYTRKRQANPDSWKKNIRKRARMMGEEYFSPTTKTIVPRKCVKPHNCAKCRFECAKNVSEETRQELFNSFYKENMTHEIKRDFICRQIEVKPASNRYGKTYKENSRTYQLPVNDVLKRVCKQFFLKTLDIRGKMVRCTLNRKVHGKFEGHDQRGKHVPPNKSSDATIKHIYIKEHIETFPVMESHYKRKHTKRHFLSQELYINKMYELYKIQCEEKGLLPAGAITYRRIFCNCYNISFHKPKKDTCQQCNAYAEKEKANLLTDEDRSQQRLHLNRKEKGREKKEEDKRKAKEDKSIFTATFDLEAVLNTPCSNVSQFFYKRKLSCYNLSVYDLATKDGTCYLWDKSQAERGSFEIGSCLITHLQSLRRTVKHVILYSDCCSGQNRNQYAAAGLLNVINESSNLQTIEQKFLESGHTQMECDSMHSS